MVVKRAELIEFSNIVMAERWLWERSDQRRWLVNAPAHWGPNWKRAHAKFVTFLNTGVPQWNIFVKENLKLKFWQFSTLPKISCPGAGDCLNWCYSFKAWRYPDAFFRQLQNTVLAWRGRDSVMRAGPRTTAEAAADYGYIREAFLSLPKNETVRLYVDGDFDSKQTLEFWFNLMAQRKDLKVYGYSKSWSFFLQFNSWNVRKLGQEWPTNYILNLSGGSIYGGQMRARMEALPIVRDEFVAVKAPSKMPNKLDSPTLWAQWAKAVKESARKLGYAKAFVCPGKCYACLPNQEHACGSMRFKGIPVVIGIH